MKTCQRGSCFINDHELQSFIRKFKLLSTETALTVQVYTLVQHIMKAKVQDLRLTGETKQASTIKKIMHKLKEELQSNVNVPINKKTFTEFSIQ